MRRLLKAGDKVVFRWIRAGHPMQFSGTLVRDEYADDPDRWLEIEASKAMNSVHFRVPPEDVRLLDEVSS